jgi:hypothetical protein
MTPFILTRRDVDNRALHDTFFVMVTCMLICGVTSFGWSSV